MTMLLPSACKLRLRARPVAIRCPSVDHGGQGFRRGVGQVDGVLLRDDQRVAADERPDVEDRQVVVVLVDTDGRRLAGDDGAEHAGHSATLAGAPRQRGQPATLPPWTHAISPSPAPPQQARMLAAGSITAPALLDVYLERIARLDRGTAVLPRGARRHRAARRPPPPRSAWTRVSGCRCSGVPIAIKDDVDVAGEVTTYGSAAHGPARHSRRRGGAATPRGRAR